MWEGKSTTLLYKSHGDNPRPSMAGTTYANLAKPQIKGVDYNIMYKLYDIVHVMHVHVQRTILYSCSSTNCKPKTELSRLWSLSCTENLGAINFHYLHMKEASWPDKL